MPSYVGELGNVPLSEFGEVFDKHVARGEVADDLDPTDTIPLERELLFPAIRGSDITRWYARPAINVLVTQDPTTRSPYPATEMRVRWPRTYAYIRQFEGVLLSRGSNTVRELAQRTEPWAMFGIGDYTFAPYRVAWKRMASDLVAAVLSEWHGDLGSKPLLPTETTSFIPVDEEDEAHFLAAVLNSRQVRAYVQSFSSAGRGFGAPTVLRHINIPRFDRTNTDHLALSDRARDASALVSAGNLEPLPLIEAEVERLVGVIFGLETHLAEPPGRTGPLAL